MAFSSKLRSFSQTIEEYLKKPFGDIPTLSTVVKYAFCALLILLSLKTTGDVEYVVVSALELLLIAGFCNFLVKRWRIVAQVLNDLLVLFFNVQMLVLLFGNSYLQLVMLSNLNFIEDLGGKALEYGLGVVLLLAFSFLPITGISLPDQCYVTLKLQPKKTAAHMETVAYRNRLTVPSYAFGVVLLYLAAMFSLGPDFSPGYSYGDLVAQSIKMNELKQATSSSNNAADDFYKEEVTNYRAKDEQLGARPNVILIFTEGLSQSVVEDERNIMPNLREFESSSLFFENYYNHTFATLRGLIGQLYSGYQMDNNDTNSLVSIMDVFEANLYETAFINTEPANTDFCEYLNALGFEEMLGSVEDKKEGASDSYSDRQAYELLFDTAESLNSSSKSFFLSVYTFGTHASLDSTDEIYGDGSNAMLNKFYDLDYQFGEFLDKFNESSLSDNTIIVFTTDHCTYGEADFATTFPETERAAEMCDRVPLCIYYKGIEPEVIDAKGRNTLDLAPTILDYLDMSAPNFFLGSSLFSSTAHGSAETTFNEEALFYSTKRAQIRDLTSTEQREAESIVRRYYAARR